MRLLSLFLLFTLCACGQNASTKRHIPNSKAQQLVDSAIILGYQQKQYDKAISLLNQAIDIDSNYIAPYNYKLSIQWMLKEYDSALESANTLVKMRPESPDRYVQIGLLYDLKGDTITSKKFYQEAVPRYNKILDTMSTKNRSYDYFLMNKGIDLVFVGRQKEGNEIFKVLYNKESNKYLKDYYGSLINKSKNDILKIISNDNMSASNMTPSNK